MSNTDFVVDKVKLEVRITRVFKTTPERLWQAHTRAEDIAQWWEGTTIDKLDVQVGGQWRFVSGDKGEHAFHGEFRELDEPHKIVRTFEYEPVAGHVMVESVTFEPVGENQTKQTTISKFDNLDDLNGMVSMGMSEGAEAGMDRLAAVVEKG